MNERVTATPELLEAIAAAERAQVVSLGAMSAQCAETTLGSPEAAIEYDHGAGVLLAASAVDEIEVSSVCADSPFGI